MSDQEPMAKTESPDRDPSFPPYPSEHSEEAHYRARCIEEEIGLLDENHHDYMERYSRRRSELELMLRMCHTAIVEYDQAMQPQHAVPMGYVPDSMKESGLMGVGGTAEAQRTPYDTGIRPPKIRR
jgi:hypothetical protein